MGMMLKGKGDGDFQFVSPAVSGIVVEGQGMGLTVADINQDARPDLVMTVNNLANRVWLNQSTFSGSTPFTISLKGLLGNAQAIGSRVVLETQSGKSRTFEVTAGSGYLSQSVASLFASNDQSDPVVEVKITWPNGITQTEKVTLIAKELVFEQTPE